jgi:hypothetical protein
MATEWKWRMMLFVRAVDNTPENKQAFGQIFVDGGSGETLANESKAWDSVVRFSATGQAPAQAFGLETAVKASMRDEIKTFIAGLTNAHYVVVANTQFPQYAQNELIETTFDITPSGQIMYWQDVVDYIYAQFGQQVIQDEEVL